MMDNFIRLEGPGGALYSTLEFFKVNVDHLEFIEGYRTCNEYDYSGMTVYYSSAWNGETEEFTVRGDYENPDAAYSREEMLGLYEIHKSDCWIPQLTIIT